MNNIACFTSYKSVGCTFLDWSVHYLCGADSFFNLQEDDWVTLSPNPITKNNAHGHKKNHPGGYNKTKSCIERLRKLPTDQFCSLYPSVMPFKPALEHTGININELHNTATFKHLTDFIVNDYNKIFDLCHEQKIKVVFVGTDDRVKLYHQSNRNLDRSQFTFEPVNSEQEISNEFQQIFFKESLKQWKELSNIWDTRERMALDMRPLDESATINLQHPHLYINCIELWTRTEEVVKRVLDYLDLDLNESRFIQWLPICQAWQKQQYSILEFVYNQPHIVDAIVNNWHYDINLTFEQEAIIQHFLIYQHNLNLKTWELIKFPSNTKDLHKLLEPNIHRVPKIY